jgi:glycosyltransferase involved in cell wall biosynthesis
MIAKNEEKHLAKCLSSAKPLVDEMILVDTGSTDRTKDIANAFGGKVYDYKWTGDFSEARNFSLSKASGDWILVLDADELISPADYASLKKIIGRSNRKEAYSITTRNYVNNASLTGWTPNDGIYDREQAGTGWFPSAKVRLFRNNSGIKFENSVHELVEPSLNRLGVKIRRCNVPVHHYGKLVENKVISKGEKYYDLGKEKLKEKNRNVQALTELAIQAGELRRYEDAVELWKELISIKPDNPKAFHNMGYAYIELGKYDKALIASRKAIELDPELKGAHLNYSICELCMGDAKMAISNLENLLRKAPDYPPAIGELATGYCIEGQNEKATQCLEKIKKMGFDCTDYLYKRAKRFVSVKRPDYAVKLLSVAVESNNANADTLLLLSECLKRKENVNVFPGAESKTMHGNDTASFLN